MSTNIENPFLDEEFWKTATLKSVEEHIKNGVDVNEVKSGSNITPLVASLYCVKNPNIIKTLLDNGANIKTKFINHHHSHYNMLMWASIWNENGEIIKTLIDYGADVNETNRDGNTALVLAVQRASFESSFLGNLSFDSPDVVNALIECGADVNHRIAHNGTALMIACKFSKSEPVIEKLLQNGADVNASDLDGNTPLTLAIASGQSDVRIRTLIKYGANVNATLKDGTTVLTIACDSFNDPYDDSFDYRIIRTLVENGADGWHYDSNNQMRSESQ